MLYDPEPSPHDTIEFDFPANMERYYRCSDAQALKRLIPLAELTHSALLRIAQQARQLVAQIRQTPVNPLGVQALMNRFPLSSPEGLGIMGLAEALLRVPDPFTTDGLIRDRLSAGDWETYLHKEGFNSAKAMAFGIRIAQYLLDEIPLNDRLTKLTKPLVRIGMHSAMRLMGNQFVMGHTIAAALKRARRLEAEGYRYSYDMLGEGARTTVDADRYYRSYLDVIHHIGRANRGKSSIDGAGISVKLSALHPRYEFSQRRRVMSELVPRLNSLALAARRAKLGFTVDAEEAHRLALSVDIIEAVFRDPRLASWNGFGIAVQAYQKRALDVIDWCLALSRQSGRKFAVRLVKGAYWDTEIKLSQMEGLAGYPVFTRKAATDVSYQACASRLLQNRDHLYPQFATHNAYTVAAILEMAGNRGDFEFQRLHGMGEALYTALRQTTPITCRIYAPVGAHRDLLAYLVRRLLENGANSSFVNHIVDPAVPVDSLVQDPVAVVKGWTEPAHPQIPLPKNLFGRERINASGIDLTDRHQTERLKSDLNQWCQAHIHPVSTDIPPGHLASINPADHREVVGWVPVTEPQAIEIILQRAVERFETWSRTPIYVRAQCLERLAETLEQNRQRLITLCVKEGGKTLINSLDEVREAVDFCRYYARQALHLNDLRDHWGVTGDIIPRGPILCISPWNFPLAIFMGQITAALAAGNSVLAKPAGPTGLIAREAVALISDCGFPPNLVQLLHSPGRIIGERIVPDDRIKGVMFTGSTEVGATIARRLAARPGPRIPLIAETGGQNALIVDAGALPEQVVDDVITSGFDSAGQRCSALRVLFLQHEIADRTIAMLAGAMQELRVGDPAWLRTDVGPVIDTPALNSLNAHVANMEEHGRLIYRCDLSKECQHGTFFAPRLYEIDRIDRLPQEIFGPIVHIVRYDARNLEHVFAAINRTGFGLTFGVHTRSQKFAQTAAKAIKAGNVYVNRNIVGAVVGVQPFGGRGLSGTGPKAGGPAYLLRLVNSPVARPMKLTTKAASTDPGKFVSGTEIETTLQALAQAQSRWQAIGVRQRVTRLDHLLRQLLPHLSGAKAELERQWQLLAEEALAMMDAPQELTGPTGETNRLFHEPRGTLLCLNSSEVDITAGLIQLYAALLAGNTVLGGTIETQAALPVASMFRSAGLSDVCRQIRLTDRGSLERAIAAPHLKGVAVVADDEQVREIDLHLRLRPGEILPLITETGGPTLLSRFVTEKTVSTNTTAAGGNASLMMLGG